MPTLKMIAALKTDRCKGERDDFLCSRCLAVSPGFKSQHLLRAVDG
jgi:hypothetical protein